MNKFPPPFSLAGLLVGCTCILSAIGCGTSVPEFSTNRIYLRAQENKSQRVLDRQVVDIATAVTALFGSPNTPYFVKDSSLEVDKVLDAKNLEVAAGPVTKDNFGKGQGLYRKHCVHCHGISGDGMGPTAQFLNPYPRDFRKGVFKFKSTEKGKKPTNEDLTRIVTNGIAGTAMPSFEASLKKGEIKAIVDYVKYLSIRGQVERNLIEFQTQEADYSEDAESAKKEFLNTELLVNEILVPVLDTWKEVEEEDYASRFDSWLARSKEYDRWSPEFDELELGKSIERGKALYYGVGGCLKCHGPSQLGDGEQTDYDDWLKDFHDWAGSKNEQYDERRNEYNALGGLRLRNIIPRNLRSGVYRGGRRPIDIFWRVRNGIDGTPMPGADPSVINDEGVWDIVNFVFSVPYQKMSRAGDESSYSRERQ